MGLLATRISSQPFGSETFIGSGIISIVEFSAETMTICASLIDDFDIMALWQPAENHPPGESGSL